MEDAPGPERNGGPRRLRVSNRLAHFLIITTNVVQLLLIELFLVLMLVTLDGAQYAWSSVFAPLWISDIVTLLTSAHEVSRLVSPVVPASVRRNMLITQLNRIKGTVCTAVFKYLVVRRLSDPAVSTPALVITSPFYVCALVRLVLHYFKEKVPATDPSPSNPPKRPGTPVNPLHLLVALVACRVDDLLQLSWAATLFPTWALLALLGVTLVAAGVLGVGIFVTGEPREHGQRALFCICYGVLLTMSASGLVFQLQLVRRLDGLAHVSNAEIIAPLLAAYAGVLLFYLAFTFILPRLVEYDLAALAERPDEEAEAADGVLEAICSQLAPPCLVQQSSTLFQRVNSAMLQAFLTSAAALDGKPRPSASSIAVAPEQPGAREASQAEGAPPPAVRAGAPAGCDLEAGSAREGDVVAVGAFDPSPVLSEYEDLQRELGEWLRQHSGHGCARLQPPDEQRRLGQTHRPPLQRAASHVSVGDLEAGGAEGERAGSADGADGGTEMMAAIRQSGAEGAHHAAEPRAERASRHSAAADLAPPVREAWQAARGAEPPALPLAPDALAAPRHDAPATAAARAQADSGARAQGDGEVPRAPGARASAASEGGAAEVPPSVRHVGVGASLPEPIVARSLSPRMGLRYPAPLSVPPEILSKLRRFVHLKRQIASQVVSAALSAPELLVTQAQAQGQQGGQPIRAQAAKEGGVDGAPDGAARGAAALVRVAEPRAEAACVGVGTAVQRGPAPRQAGRSAAAGNTLAEEEEAEQAAECSSPAVETASTAAPHADSDDETGEDAACWICCEGPRDAVFLECGHGGVCLACAQRCLRNRGRHCPMCRQHIGQVVQINPQQARYEGSAIVQVHEAGAHILDQLDSLATEGGEPPAETAEEAAEADDGALPPARPPGRRTFPRFSRASMRR